MEGNKFESVQGFNAVYVWTKYCVCSCGINANDPFPFPKESEVGRDLPETWASRGALSWPGFQKLQHTAGSTKLKHLHTIRQTLHTLSSHTLRPSTLALGPPADRKPEVTPVTCPWHQVLHPELHSKSLRRWRLRSWRERRRRAFCEVRRQCCPRKSAAGREALRTRGEEGWKKSQGWPGS